MDALNDITNEQSSSSSSHAPFMFTPQMKLMSEMSNETPTPRKEIVTFNQIVMFFSLITATEQNVCVCV